MLSLEGKQLGNYDVLRRIRVGGMGAVYEGRQRTAFDRRVAIKVILGDYAADRDMRRRFAREARTIARLQHPHILPLIEFGDAQGILYLVMPFIEGGTLTSYLRRNLPEFGEVSAIYQQLLDAVEYAHEQGLIHRDIKSSNVLLDLRRNSTPYIYLADFGLVRTMRPNEASRIGQPIPLEQVPGTPHYMAPEQTLGIVTPLTDIYALGVLLYQMLTGNLPYNDPDEIRVIEMQLHNPIPLPSLQDASIPIELDDVVRTAMAKDPEDRYQSIAELREAFLAALKGPGQTISQENEAIIVEPVEEDTNVVETIRRHTATQKRSLEPPQPIIMQQQPRFRGEVAPSVAVRVTRDLAHEKLERADRLTRTTDAVQSNPRPRIIEEPVTTPRKRFIFPLLAVIVSIILIILLIVPRIFGASIFPADFPFFGNTNGTTVAITARSNTLQNTFLLVGSPQAKTPDLQTRTIPVRTIKITQSSNMTVNTTGTQQTPGVKARGHLALFNGGSNPISISQGQEFTTLDNIGFHSLNTTTVPPKQGEKAGMQIITLEADQTGKIGNIPANDFNGPCCNRNLTINNPQAFDGGIDPATTHFVTQSDLDSAKDTQAQKLQQQIAQQLARQLKADEVIAGQPGYNVIKVSSDNPVNTSVDKVQVTVNISGQASVYSTSVATQAAMILLSRQAQQSYGTNYQLQGKPIMVGNPNVTNGKDGIVYLKVTIRGTWAYNFSTNQINKLREPIKGATADAAKAYLKSQPGVGNVEIHLPFGTDHLPTTTDEITISIKQDTETP